LPTASSTTLDISRELFTAIKTSPDDGWVIARGAGIRPETLSGFLTGRERVKPDDPRVLAIAEVVGVAPDRAFSRRSWR
jgi:hypothetical protein